MHLLDISCILPAGMPTTVTSALLGPHGQHLVIKTRIRADRSHSQLLNPVEQVARSILYRAVLYIRRASLGLFFAVPNDAVGMLRPQCAARHAARPYAFAAPTLVRNYASSVGVGGLTR